jgi:hypothetical protein
MLSTTRTIALLSALVTGLGACGRDGAPGVDDDGEATSSVVVGLTGRDPGRGGAGVPRTVGGEILIAGGNDLDVDGCDVTVPIDVSAVNGLDFVAIDLSGTAAFDVELLSIDAEGGLTPLEVKPQPIDADLLARIRAAMASEGGSSNGFLTKLSPNAVRSAAPSPAVESSDEPGARVVALGARPWTRSTGLVVPLAPAISANALAFTGLGDRSISRVVARAHFRGADGRVSRSGRLSVFAGRGESAIRGAAFRIPFLEAPACDAFPAGEMSFTSPVFVTPMAPFSVNGCDADLHFQVRAFDEGVGFLALQAPRGRDLLPRLYGFDARNSLYPLEIGVAIVDADSLDRVRAALSLGVLSDARMETLRANILGLAPDILADLRHIAGIGADMYDALAARDERLLLLRLGAALEIARRAEPGGVVYAFDDIPPSVRARRLALGMRFEADPDRPSGSDAIDVFVVGTRSMMGNARYFPSFADCATLPEDIATIVPTAER